MRHGPRRNAAFLKHVEHDDAGVIFCGSCVIEENAFQRHGKLSGANTKGDSLGIASGRSAKFAERSERTVTMH